MQPITSAGTSGIGSAPLGPVEGSWVFMVFLDPDQQFPVMLGTFAGAYQTPEALATGQFTIEEADPSGAVVLTNAPKQQNADGTPAGVAVNVKTPDGKVMSFPDQQSADAFKKEAGIK
jgi:hypothetical protein